VQIKANLGHISSQLSYTEFVHVENSRLVYFYKCFMARHCAQCAMWKWNIRL